MLRCAFDDGSVCHLDRPHLCSKAAPSVKRTSAGFCISDHFSIACPDIIGVWTLGQLATSHVGSLDAITQTHSVYAAIKQKYSTTKKARICSFFE